jgi:galactitol-specific phosphotransferase system IIC component
MKRWHHSCTWAGAIVGAIPPLMGYAAATGFIFRLIMIIHMDEFKRFLKKFYGMKDVEIMTIKHFFLFSKATFHLSCF